MAATYKSTTARLVKLWQKRLALRDWEIDLEVVAENDSPDSWGEIVWFADSREAQMKISRGLGPWQHESTVVHELLHLLLQGHQNDYGGYDVHEERAINTLAALLVASYRGRAKD